jgi:hypothetical protein
MDHPYGVAFDADHGPDHALQVIRPMPPRSTSPPPTVEQATPKERTSRYVVEIRDATGASFLLTAAEWTASERDMATIAILRLVGHKLAAQSKRKASKARGEEFSPSF